MGTVEVAKRVGKTDGRIRQICREHNIGCNPTNRGWMLTETDVKKIQKIIDERGKDFSKNK